MEKERIVEELEGLRDWEQAELWNEYCYDNRYDEDVLHDMDELDEALSTFSPTEIIDFVEGENFDTCDDWFTFDGYGSLKSYRYADEIIDFEVLADYVINEGEKLRYEYGTVEDILSNLEEEEEEEEEEEA